MKTRSLVGMVAVGMVFVVARLADPLAPGDGVFARSFAALGVLERFLLRYMLPENARALVQTLQTYKVVGEVRLGNLAHGELDGVLDVAHDGACRPPLSPVATALTIEAV